MPRTVFLSRLIGLYCIVFAVFMMADKAVALETVKAMLQIPSLMLLLGLLILVVGLAMVLSHNVWSGGALSVVITIIGWIALIKGLLLLFLTGAMATEVFFVQLHFEQWFYMYAGIALVLGIYLTYSGFAVQSRRLEALRF